LGLYGISPLGDDESRCLRPVARLVSTIISLKKWSAGTPIGYGCRGVTERDSVIATVPIGYADGVDRHLGLGRAGFVVNGVKCPTIGNICMDLLMLDVTDAPDVKVGDEVEIFGPSAPIEKLAETLDTIPYEVLTSISPRVRRTYFHR
ncbi:MAG: bifunctional UDP-N-acetylmuramoyl-tripeptide:D-alanyl-D-alanine ligase/alanine racemase, partial [Muribaculaceae bacterium]|nr:bifunctional UDP-N-acetylmuramoyl-tripeptide:D-alanyl-D-alanine ligase/alanine racemase [Muribaculaceae bacterium]